MKLRLAEDADVIFVEQGQTFDMHLECVDEEGNVAKLGTCIIIHDVHIECVDMRRAMWPEVHTYYIYMMYTYVHRVWRAMWPD